jgi:hypothetical protein
MDVNLSKFNGYKSFTPSLISQKKKKKKKRRRRRGKQLILQRNE